MKIIKLIFHILNTLFALFFTIVTIWGIVDLERSLLYKGVFIAFTIYFAFVFWYLVFSVVEIKRTKGRISEWNTYRRLSKEDKDKHPRNEVFLKRSVVYHLLFGISVVLAVLVSLAEGKIINALIISWLLVIILIKVFLRIRKFKDLK